ncbi:MAG: methyltransferase domain-containing protein [Magnetococcales bacterium]|nr:methyltransferase domain-containing protein [Magnetococcales bacterium]
MKRFSQYFNNLQPGHDSWARRLGRRWLKTHRHPACLWDLVERLPANARVLDAGCGPGNTLELFQAVRGDLQLTGSDGALPPEVTRLQPRIQFVTADFSQEVPFEEGSFDLVISQAVIEHIPVEKVDRYGANLAHLVKPGGHLYLNFPNVRSLWVNFYDDPTHIRPYTGQAVERMLIPMGIQTVRIGIDRSFKILFLAPLYRLSLLLRGRRDVVSFFLNHFLGTNSFFLGQKQ